MLDSTLETFDADLLVNTYINIKKFEDLYGCKKELFRHSFEILLLILFQDAVILSTHYKQCA